MDDLNIHSMTWENHLQHLQFMMMKLREVNLKLNPSKCEFVKTSIRFLGHVVNIKGTQSFQRKVKAITKYLIPTSITNINAFHKILL